MGHYHIVNQGEHLAGLAKAYRFAHYRTIYDHPENERFRAKRPNPNVIYPGDEIFIPDKESKEVSGETEKRHRFKVSGRKIALRLIVKDADGRPVRQQPYKLTVKGDSDTVFQGTTNNDGLVEAQIPASAENADLALDKVGLFWSLKIAHLDPVEEPADKTAIITGVQARLNNLGFDCGNVDGVLGPKTREAIKEFQSKVLKRENPSGEPDQQTRAELSKQHQC